MINYSYLYFSLTTGEGKIVVANSVSYPKLSNNMSYSHNPDGSTNWVVQPPTFNLPNEEVINSTNEIEEY